MNTDIQIADQIVRGGLVVALLIIILGGYRDWWRYGPAARRREQELIDQIQEQAEAYEARIAKLEKSETEWRTMAVGLLRSTSRLVQAEEQRHL